MPCRHLTNPASLSSLRIVCGPNPCDVPTDPSSSMLFSRRSSLLSDKAMHPRFDSSDLSADCMCLCGTHRGVTNPGSFLNQHHLLLASVNRIPQESILSADLQSTTTMSTQHLSASAPVARSYGLSGTLIALLGSFHILSYPSQVSLSAFCRTL